MATRVIVRKQSVGWDVFRVDEHGINATGDKKIVPAAHKTKQSAVDLACKKLEPGEALDIEDDDAT